ncbi:MAG: hypothetical protein JNK72_09855 [Myxococcales bacterium]|nr:hypothetical protein [Myxococcales bacterium]
MPLPLAALAALAGCNATYAPPVASVHHGGLGGVGAQQGAVRAGVALGGPGRGNAGVSLPLSDAVRVEAAGDLSENWRMGSAGLRVVERSASGRAALDLELGGGAGAGGQRCDNSTEPGTTCAAGVADGRSAFDRTAFGTYFGVGGGYRVHRYLELYARGRGQVTHATNVPITVFLSGIGGLEVPIGPVRLNVAAGYAQYFNDAEQNGGAIVEGGLTVPFDMGRAH